MHYLKKIIVMTLVYGMAAGGFSPPSTFGLTVRQEEDLSRQIMKNITRYYNIIQDPVINDYVNRVGQRLVATLPKRLFDYHFYVIKTDGYNAFATPAGQIFIYSGLMEAMDSEDELAGILAHEIGHVYCRHISQQIERSKKINMATLAGIAAGVLLGMAGGGAAASAVTQGSMAASQSAQLHFSRSNERQADQTGLNILTKAGYSGRGLLKMLKIIRGKQWFGAKQIPAYMMTHPAIEERIAYIDTWLDHHARTSAGNPPSKSGQFARIHLRLVTRYGNEAVVLKNFEAEVKEHPADPMAHYHYGLILARAERYPQAIAQLKIALEKRAFDPYILNDLGQIYFLDGQFKKALSILQSVRQMTPEQPECLLFIGRAQLGLGRFKEASAVLLGLAERHPQYRQAFFYLGQSLAKQGNLADAHYYLGIYYRRQGDARLAYLQFKQALKLTTDAGRKAEIEAYLQKIDNRKKDNQRKDSG